MQRLIGHTLKYGLLIAISFLSGWELSRAFYEEALPPSNMTRKVSEIPAGETLSRPSPMDEPLWYQELLKVSAAEKTMQEVNEQQSFVRGYW